MSASTGKQFSGSAPSDDSAFPAANPLDLVLLLLNRKRLYIIGLFAISVLAVLYSLLATPEYVAKVHILPFQNRFSSPLEAMLGDLPISGLKQGFDFMGKRSDNDRFLSILGSRRLSEIMIGRFNLVQRYTGKNPPYKRKIFMENIVKLYNQHVEVSEDDRDNIEIAVKDTSPEFAANMANAIVEVLDSLAYEINRESARGSRTFFENRLLVVKTTLDSVNKVFTQFQLKHNYFDLEQIKTSIKAVSDLEERGIAADMERELTAINYGQNARVAEATRRKKAIDNRLKDYLENGSGNLLIPLKKAPELAVQYAHLYRNVMLHETIYSYLISLREQATFREVNNSPVVTLLESAVVPQKRVSPKRSVICLVSFILGFVILSIFIVLQEFFRIQRRQNTVSYLKLQEILEHFRIRRSAAAS